MTFAAQISAIDTIDFDAIDLSENEIPGVETSRVETSEDDDDVEMDDIRSEFHVVFKRKDAQQDHNHDYRKLEQKKGSNFVSENGCDIENRFKRRREL